MKLMFEALRITPSTTELSQQGVVLLVIIKYCLQMEFETGPWTSFGNEILDRLNELIRSSQLAIMERDFNLPGKKGCRTVELSLLY